MLRLLHSEEQQTQVLLGRFNMKLEQVEANDPLCLERHEVIVSGSLGNIPAHVRECCINRVDEKRLGKGTIEAKGNEKVVRFRIHAFRTFFKKLAEWEDQHHQDFSDHELGFMGDMNPDIILYNRQ